MFLNATLQNLLNKKLKQLNELRPLTGEYVKKLQEKFSVEMNYNSNAIEGNTLTLKETYWVIKQGITVKDKPLKDHLEVKNQQEALDFLYKIIEHNKNNTFSEKLVKDIHYLIVQDTEKQEAGKYRNIDVFITGTQHTPPSALDVPIKMREFMTFIHENFSKISIVELAAIVHHKFVHIHPFRDGNGRTGRIIMNVFLMQAGFPLAIIQKNDRKKYYRVLQMADVGKYEPLVQFIAQAVLRSLNIYLDAIIPVKDKENFISLAEASKYCNYSQEYLNKLARLGKIDAHKEKRNWLTTKQAIQNYIHSHSL
jgi:Fic family protein